MNFKITKEWLQKKLAEMEAAGVEEITEVGVFGVTDPYPGFAARVRAKMRCNSVTKSGSKEHPSMNVQLGAVYSCDPDSENRSFASATPSGSVSLNIDAGRPAAHAFELGSEYYVDFIPLGQQVIKYVRDGFPVMPLDVVLVKRDGSDPIPARITAQGEIDAVLDGADVKENAWSGKVFFEAGYTHWRYPVPA